MNEYIYRCIGKTEAEWNHINPILSIGEMSFVTDTHKLKIGDGFTPWKGLPYITGENSIVIKNHIGEFPKQGSGNTLYVADGEIYIWNNNGYELLNNSSEAMVLEAAPLVRLVDNRVDEEGNEIVEPYIEITNEREIIIPEELKNIAVQYDNNIETVTFKCPRYWDGRDLSAEPSKMQVVYQHSDENVQNGQDRVYVTERDDNFFLFDWTISADLTTLPGSLSIMISIAEDVEETKPAWVWNSQIKNNGLNILPGYPIWLEVPEEEAAGVVEQIARSRQPKPSKDQLDGKTDLVFMGIDPSNCDYNEDNKPTDDSYVLLNIDTTYSSNSNNPQSGKAVAEALDICVPKIEVVQGPPYDNVITVSESAETDENGLPLNSEYKHTPIDEDGTGLYAGWIVRRNSNANVRTGTPIEDEECVNKQYIDGKFVLTRRGDRIHSQVYGIQAVDDAYADTTFTLESSDDFNPEIGVGYGDIPRRHVNGNLYTTEPTTDISCTNKKYVDELVASAALGDTDFVISETYTPESDNVAQSGKAVAEAVATKVSKLDPSDSNNLAAASSVKTYAYVRQGTAEKLLQTENYATTANTLPLRDNNGRITSEPLGFPTNVIGDNVDKYPNYVITATNAREIYQQITTERTAAIADATTNIVNNFIKGGIKHLYVRPVGSNYYDYDENGELVGTAADGKYFLKPGHAYLAQGSNLKLIDSTGKAISDTNNDSISGASALLICVPSEPTYEPAYISTTNKVAKGYVWYVYCMKITQSGTGDSAIFVIQETTNTTNTDKNQKTVLLSTSITSSATGGGGFHVWDVEN